MSQDGTVNTNATDGILWAYRIDGQGGGQQLGDDGALNDRTTAFEWYHLQSDVPESIAWLQKSGADEVVIDTLTVNETRPRTFLHKDGVLLVLRGVNTKPGADPEDMVSLRVWYTHDRVITARKRERKLLSVEDVRLSIERGAAPRTPGEFVTMLVENLANRIGDVVDDIDEELTQFETDLAERPMPEARRLLSDSRRQTAAIRRYLAPQRDALDSLFRSRGVLTDQEAFSLRDQTDRSTRYVEDLDLARERTLVLQEELQNRVAEQQNARMYVLSIVAAIFLPLSFLTGVFGMNVAGMPGLENPRAFLYLALGMTAVAAGLIGFMRWRRWM